MKPGPFKWKAIVGEYFIFSKWQRRAAVFLVGSLLVIVFAPAIYLYFFRSRLVKTDGVMLERVTALKVKTVSATPSYNHDEPINQTAPNQSSERNAVGELFPFDPNTASAADWQRLGIRNKTISTIQHFLAKGGHFKKAEDLGKIYGLHIDEAERLMPYVRIGNKEEKMPAWKEGGSDAGVKTKTRSAASREPIDINTADTTAFIALPGIGSKLAARIVNYREKLHGFYAIEQVGETYGLPDSTFQKIKPQLRVSASSIQKMNINTATTEELKTPYIRFNVANAIVQYRIQKGPFGTVEDLRKIMLIDEALFIKIAPYLKTE